MGWAVPNSTRAQVDAAGAILAAATEENALGWDEDDWAKYDAALEIIGNWRASHNYPLNTFQVNLRRAAPKVDPNCLVAQRIKRLSSISAKLRRFPGMRLSQMQDIGGCRAVVKSVIAARALADFYQTKTNIKHTLAGVDDYLESPQRSGYRGIHIKYRYFSNYESTQIYDGLRIEMQIRSQYQHAWATAVETAGMFVRQALKSSVGATDWLRFFSLMGSAIAIRERQPIVPGTPEDRNELLRELEDYAGRLNVGARLKTYGDALQKLTQNTGGKSHYYLLALDVEQSQLTVKAFPAKSLEQASFEYLAAEKAAKDNPSMDAVLVSVDSVNALQKAYPNYFADTRVFVELLGQALSGRQRRIFTGALRLGR